MAANALIGGEHNIRRRRARLSAAFGVLPALLVTGLLALWAAPAGAWVAVEPTIAGSSASEEPATSQSLHDECASGVSATLCEKVLTVVHVQVQIPAGGAEDCEGPARVGYASNIGSNGHLTTSWPGGDWGQNCYAMEGCSNSSACELNWTVDPFAYGGKRDCTNKSFAVEVSLEYLGNGEGYSKAHQITIEPPNGCKNGGSGQSGGGTGGGGSTGGGSSEGNDCLATVSCIVPLLRPPDLIRGQVEVKHADGTSECLCRVTALRSDDTVGTDKIGHARLRFADFDVQLGINSSMRVPVRIGGPLDVLGKFLLGIEPRSATFDGLYDRLAEVWAGPPAKPPVLPEPGVPLSLRAVSSAASAEAVFTVEATLTSTRVEVYKGTVSLRNTSGGSQRTVTVRAGFQSTVHGSKPPSKPRRFKAPAHPFWK